SRGPGRFGRTAPVAVLVAVGCRAAVPAPLRLSRGPDGHDLGCRTAAGFGSRSERYKRGNPRTLSRVFAIRSLIIDAARSGFGYELSGVGWVPTDAHRHSVREACGLAVQMPGRPTALPAEIGRLGERTARDRA